MLCTSQRGHGGEVQGDTSASVDTGKKCTIHWEGCKENEDAHIKLFSDSSKDAKEQGWKKKQSGSSRHIVWSHKLLWKKYNEFNKDLKQSGAGKMYVELQEDPKMKSLIDIKLEKFPWWPELHGWWQTNPAFNHAFSTADAGQDFASAALEHFNISKPLATDNNPEDGEIVEINSGSMDDGVMDDMIIDQPPCIASLQPLPLLPSDCSPSNTSDSFSLVPLPKWYQ
ncbi:hypothetical protein BDR04DRAFT_1120885 [Suillus decipiens]|nr:hypothetical protein BDR04DRAFT_1120885 [Suillus decipiens]